MIVDKIYQFLEDETDFGNDEILDYFLTEVSRGFKRQFMEEKQNKATLRLSSIGKCMTQQWLNAKGYTPEPFSPRTLITFWQGDLIEACTLSLAKMAGVDIRREQEEVDILGVKGHIDGVLYENDKPVAVVEIKSMADFSFKRFSKEGIDNTFGYESQGIAYATSLGLDKVIWVATNKNTGHMDEYVHTITDEMKTELIDRSREILTFDYEDTRPPREYTPDKKGKLPLQCQYCNQKWNCYEEEGLETVINKGKPSFYVKQEDAEEVV